MVIILGRDRGAACTHDVRPASEAPTAILIEMEEIRWQALG